MIETMLAFGVVAGLVPSPHTLVLIHAKSRTLLIWGCLQGIAADLIYVGVGVVLSFSAIVQPDFLIRAGGLYFCIFGVLRLSGRGRTKSTRNVRLKNFTPFLAQIMNPNPAVFWLTIGVPLASAEIADGRTDEAVIGSVLFLLEVYLFKFLFVDQTRTLTWLPQALAASTVIFGIYLNLF